MGLAAEPIGGVAATLFISLADIFSSEWDCLRLWDKRPDVAGIVG